jgi:hypothetical protein
MCYTSEGYELVRGPEKIEIEFSGGTHQIQRSLFRSAVPGRGGLEVCYAWRQAQHWLVPSVPRVAFGGGRYLFKFQAAARLAPGEDAQSESMCLRFLQAFLDALEKTVFQSFQGDERIPNQNAADL